MDDATRRYGIDVGASIDHAKLNEQSVRVQVGAGLQALGSSNAARYEQFGASYGLDAARLRFDDVDNDAYGRYPGHLLVPDRRASTPMGLADNPSRRDRQAPPKGAAQGYSAGRRNTTRRSAQLTSRMRKMEKLKNDIRDDDRAR
jgi:hypothetical protein